MSRYANLEACCGGTINPETLHRFQLAMREYETFMVGLQEILAPVRLVPHVAYEDRGSSILVRIDGRVTGTIMQDSLGWVYRVKGTNILSAHHDTVAGLKAVLEASQNYNGSAS